MRIGVNAIFLSEENNSADNRFLLQILKQLIHQHTKDEFIFFVNRNVNAELITAPNVKQVVIASPLTNLFSLKYWFDIKLSASLRSNNIDVMLQLNGICSMATKIPQILFLSDLLFKTQTQFIPRPFKKYKKWFSGKMIQKADAIITFSEFIKQEIIKLYPIASEKTNIVAVTAGSNFQPIIDWQERQNIKDGYADGREYFLYTGGISARNNIINVLKAFSGFKKWQKSNMKLLIMGENEDADILKKLSSYKYKEDVVVLNSVTEQQRAKIMAGAYALINLSAHDYCGVDIIEAMQCEVPVIAGNSTVFAEIAADAALYINDDNDASPQLIALYKGEHLRKSLIMKGKERASSFNNNNTSAAIWQTIIKAGSR